MCNNTDSLENHNIERRDRLDKYLFDNSKLRGRIVEKYGTISNFSDSIGKNRSSMCLALNDKRSMDRNEILNICRALDIESKDIADYFFTTKVVKT